MYLYEYPIQSLICNDNNLIKVLCFGTIIDEFKGVSKMMELWLAIVLIVVALIAGLVVGFFLARKYFKSYLDKNPPINEKMIRAMMSQMGRKPSEKQVRQVMASMKQNQ